MSIFGNYSKYYNLLYKDKDYAGEVEYVHNLIQKYSPGAKSILDLGCGTGRHDFLLSEKGYSVTGVDISEEMLAEVNSRLSTLNLQPSTLQFTQGNIQTIRLPATFDVVLSLFGVISYQTTNDMLLNTFRNVHRHLRGGGAFLFDCWYGPGVLSDRPGDREKKIEDSSLSIVRCAHPTMHPNENIVDVHYTITAKDESTGIVEELRETHRMRYLFKPEIEMMLDHAGLTLIQCEEWMTGKEPGFDSWGVCFIAVKKKRCTD